MAEAVVTTRVGRRLRRVPALYVLSGIVAVALLLPEIFLVVQASDAGWSEVSGILFRPLSAELLRSGVVSGRAARHLFEECLRDKG